MIEITHPRDRQRLRRIALASQGLLRANPFGRGVAGTQRAVEHLGYIQIDSISVVERAHHHVLHSRVPDFEAGGVARLLETRDIFEYWAHAAAFLPMTDFRFSLPYKHALRGGRIHWFRNPDRRLMARLLERVRRDGPLRARDVASTERKRGGWWDWKPAKRALEQLYMEGHLMISAREGFEKSYDLTERVLPAGTDTRMPDSEEYARHLFDQQRRSHGVVSLKGLTYLRRDPGLRQAMKALVEDKVACGQLEALHLADGSQFLIDAGALEERLPRASQQLRILSPFDNAVIQRDRLQTLFDFAYQIECYLPASRRRYGYFSLPLLYRDSFVGRMDCKAHRRERRLEIKSLHLEHQGTEEEPLLLAFAAALEGFLRFQACDYCSLTAVYPKNLQTAVDRALGSLR